MDEEKLLQLIKEAQVRVEAAHESLMKASDMFGEVARQASGDELSDETMKSIEDKQKQAEFKQEMATKALTRAEGDLEYYQKLLEEKRKAILPADLPNFGGDPGNSPTPASPETSEQRTAKSIYQMQYGTVDASIKAVINDLYGSSYDEHRYKQKQAFFNYIRVRDDLITPDDRRLLKSFIPTPNFIQQAINAGWNTKAIKSTMVEAIDTLGGYTVPVDLQEEIISREPGLSVMSGRAREGDTSRDRKQFVKRSGGGDQYIGNVAITWVNETPAAGASETNATFSLEDIPVHTGMAVVPLSKNVLEDSFANLADEVSYEFSTATAIAKDNAYLVGDGVGKPQGILPGGTGLATGLSSVNSGDANLLTFNGLIAMTFGIASQYKVGTRQGPNGQETRAVWIAERATYQAIAQLVDADGAYLWTEMRGNNAVGQPTTLRGYTILEQEAMPTIGAGTYPVLFGNPEAYEIVNRIGMTVQRYDVNPGENLIKLELRFRVGGQLTRPWMMVAQVVSA